VRAAAWGQLPAPWAAAPAVNIPHTLRLKKKQNTHTKKPTKPQKCRRGGGNCFLKEKMGSGASFPFHGGRQALGAQMFFVTRGAGGWQPIRTERRGSRPPFQGLRASAPVPPAARPGWGRAAAASSLEQHFPTVWRSDTWLSHIPAPAGLAALGQESRQTEGCRCWELLISRF